VSAKERITRLEALLDRVKTRASQPRPRLISAPAAAIPAAAAAPAYVPEAQPPTAPPPPNTVPPPTIATSPPPEMTGWSAPPAAVQQDAASLDTSDERTEISYSTTTDDVDVDVEVSTEVVEVDIDIDEPLPAESGQQPVAELADARAPEMEEPAVTEQYRSSDAPELQMMAGANEVVEPEPSSSPRPITDPSRDQPAYEEESSPRHTPPPESGKQVAVAPSAPPRRPSEPAPPSLEGHTLVGGWREPGIPQQTGQHQGVRVPAPASPDRAVSVPEISQTRLSPEVTRAELPDTAKVASFEGSAPAFKPSSFGELLDATLGL